MKRLIWKAALVVLLVLGLHAFWWEPRSLVTREVTLPLPCWQGAPLRVAVVSDLHAGAPYIDDAKVKQVVATINAGRPDIIVLLGDFVVQGVLAGHFVPPEPTARTLAVLHAPLGIYAVLGNHDWWFNAPRVAAALKAADIRVIDDTAVPVDRFWLIGVSDYWEGRHDVGGAMAQVTDARPAIVITHNPDLFPQIPSRACLTLAGHTHGGQVALPFVGRLIVPSRFGQRYAIGAINEGGRQLFVTAGIGTSIIPVRFRVPPEIVFLTIAAARPPSSQSPQAPHTADSRSSRGSR